jgi:hypothetical protein
MDSSVENKDVDAFRLLTLTQEKWGERIAENIKRTAPEHWVVHQWKAPRVLPPIIDYPEEFLPESFPQATVVLALGYTSGLAQLVPDIVEMSGAQAVLAPIDNNESLPPGLANQLQKWLADLHVESVFPKPFCSLTETTYNKKPKVVSYENEHIREFARYYGKPEFNVILAEGVITEVEVIRDSACGCAQYIAENLSGVGVDDALEKAGMLHHHFPCLASMEQDLDYHDTLMHVSGNILKDTLKEKIKDHLTVTVVRPTGYVEEP